MFTNCPVRTMKKVFALALALFSAGLLSAAELKFYAPFDEGEGSVTQDKAGQIEGKISRAVWVDGKVGKALKFDGKDKAEGSIANVVFGISGSDNFLHTFGGGAFSITAWIKPGSTKDYQLGSEILNTGGDRGPGWRMYYNWKMIYFRSGDGTAYWDLTSNANNNKVRNDEWNHIAVVRNAAGIETLYLNGVQAAQSPAAMQVTKSPSGRLTIGAYGGGAAYGFMGIIDEVKIYSGELTAEEISKEATPGI
ncbi:MAG: LamG domain-containing protein [Verrucomicrobia bacterium]|nr:LamG domain-containing protein [Verrucomicrobiota bacterium]